MRTPIDSLGQARQVRRMMAGRCPRAVPYTEEVGVFHRCRAGEGSLAWFCYCFIFCVVVVVVGLFGSLVGFVFSIYLKNFWSGKSAKNNARGNGL